MRYSDLSEAYAGLITFRELHAGRLQCMLQSAHRRLLRIRPFNGGSSDAKLYRHIVKRQFART